MSSPYSEHPLARQLRALIYNRVSADPRGTRVSVESQNRENLAFCEREGFDVAGTVTDNYRSASRYAAKGREGYDQVRRALAGDGFGRVDVLVCWESSRAQRDLEVYVQLRNLCEQFGVRYAYRGRVYDLSDGDDRFSTGLDALVDERESDRTRSRILRSHRDSALAGQPRGVTPFGYARRYDPATGRLLGQEPCPDTAPVVQDIVRRLLAGQTLYSIAKRLNDEEVPTPRQHRDQRRGVTSDRTDRGWSPGQIRHVLSRESLMGVRSHRSGSAVQATWEPIVRPADWRRVQALLRSPDRLKATRGTAAAHLLSGLAECSVCGGWLRPMRNRGALNYYCAGTSETAAKGHVAIRAEPLDAMVTAHMVGLLADPNALRAMSPPGEGDAGTAAVKREIADVEAYLAEYEAMATRREVSPTAFARIEKSYQEQLAGLRRKLAPVAVPDDVAALAGPDAPVRWEAAGLVMQRTAIRALIRVVVWPVPPEFRGRASINSGRVQIVSR